MTGFDPWFTRIAGIGEPHDWQRSLGADDLPRSWLNKPGRTTAERELMAPTLSPQTKS